MEYEDANIIVTTIVEANELLADLYAYFRTKSEVREVHRGIDLRKCDAGSLLELFVEAELNDRLAYCWWLDVRFYQSSWSIDGALLKTEDGDQRKISDIAEHSGNTVEALIEKLHATCRAIADSAKQFQFKGE